MTMYNYEVLENILCKKKLTTSWTNDFYNLTKLLQFLANKQWAHNLHTT